jgi:hypothetical protein
MLTEKQWAEIQAVWLAIHTELGPVEIPHIEAEAKPAKVSRRPRRQKTAA